MAGKLFKDSRTSLAFERATGASHAGRESPQASHVDFTEHHLGNGLRLIVNEDHTVPLAVINLWYRVGSRNEAPGRTGFAHLFEHLMFEGSRHVKRGEHFRVIEATGGKLNASTSYDRTNYFELVPSHHAEVALWLEADRMGTLLEAVDAVSLENQRAVVKNELRQNVENRPTGDVHERIGALLYPKGHPYRHPPIGFMQDLDAATLDDVHAFFRSYYAPNNCVLTVAGDVDTREVVAWVETWFGDIPLNAALAPPPDGALSTMGGPVNEEVVDSRLQLPELFLVFRTPPDGNPDHDILVVACVIAASGHGSRLHQEVVVRRQLAPSIWMRPAALVGDVSYMMAAATVAPGVNPVELELSIRETLGSLTERPPTDAEMLRAFGVLSAEFGNEIDKLMSRADTLSRDAALFDDAGRINDRLSRLRSITSEQVAALTSHLVDPANGAKLTYLPSKET